MLDWLGYINRSIRKQRYAMKSERSAGMESRLIGGSTVCEIKRQKAACFASMNP